jgi:AcrR family transcriptional regulator
MAAGTRERMVFSAMQLFRRHGYNGTGFREVVAHSRTPRGSIYHHFPEGKAELGVDALDFAADFVDDAMADALRTHGLVGGFDRFLDWWIDFLEEADFEAGCPVLAVAAETHPEAPALTAKADAVFERWQATLASALRAEGVARGRARDLAALVLSAIEGAMVLSRATGDRQPLVRVGRELKRSLADAIAVA